MGHGPWGHKESDTTERHSIYQTNMGPTARSLLEVLTSESPLVGISKPLDSERKKQRKKHVSPFIAPGASAQLSGGGSGEEPSVP